jgi:hypothetical protein
MVKAQLKEASSISKPKNKYFIIEYVSEIVEANTKEEAIAIAKQRIQDREVEVDEGNTYQVEDEDLLKEIEEDERKADEEEARASANPKK